jgi:2-amino-4-hydroxy-6-hydroxymethyldihydropteridine diphosphokinase
MTSDARWTPVYVGLGSNLANPRGQIERASEALATLPESLLVKRSSLYASTPMGPIDQPEFINAVAGLLTHLAPQAMLVELKSLEQRLGREPAVVRWGPRRIDLDLLMHGSSEIDARGLTLPHPGIAVRAFVLVPLAELAPDVQVPGLGRVRDLADRLGSAGLKRLAA